MSAIPGVTAHARQRLAERFGRDAPRTAWLRAVRDILDGRAALLARTTHGTEIYLVSLGPLPLRVVWKPACGEIITVFADDQHHTGRAIQQMMQRRHSARRGALRTRAFDRAAGPSAEEWA